MDASIPYYNLYRRNGVLCIVHQRSKDYRVHFPLPCVSRDRFDLSIVVYGSRELIQLHGLGSGQDKPTTVHQNIQDYFRLLHINSIIKQVSETNQKHNRSKEIPVHSLPGQSTGPVSAVIRSGIGNFALHCLVPAPNPRVASKSQQPYHLDLRH